MGIENSYLIYALVDPVEASVRYIGQSRRGIARAREHNAASSRKNVLLALWVEKLKERGFKPQIVVLQYVEVASQLDAAETSWIGLFRSAGAWLFNISAGGGGASYQRNQEFRDKLRQNNNRTVTDEGRKRISEANKGSKRGPLSKATADKISAANKGRRRTAEQIRKMTAARWGVR